MSNKIFKTGIYARLSREDADRIESNSIQSQRAICLAYIEIHDDLELVDTYIDDGETGSNTDRPGFQRMLQDMRSGRIDCAVSKDLSRFSRNYIDAGNYLEKIFPAMGIRYIAINDNYDSMAPGSGSDVITLPFKNLEMTFTVAIFPSRYVPVWRSSARKASMWATSFPSGIGKPRRIRTACWWTMMPPRSWR